MRTLTAKLMHDKLKLGWTASDFAAHLNITVENFWESLQQFPEAAYKHMKANLSQNEKHPRHKKSHTTIVENSEPDIIIEPEASVGLEEPLSIEPENSDDSEELKAPEESTPQDSQKTLEDLFTLQRELSAKLNSAELEHKGIVSERVQIRKEISDERDALVRIKQLIQQHQDEISVLLQRLNETAEKMEAANSQIAELRTSLSEVDADIKKMQSVTILVYTSGEITITSDTDVIQPEWNGDLYHHIVEEDELDSLTKAELKALVNVISLVQTLRERNRSYEVLFENETSEIYFKKVIG